MINTIQAFNSAQVQNGLGGKPVINEQDVVLSILQGSGDAIKKEDIVRDFRNQLEKMGCDVTEEVANALVTQALSSLKSHGKANNIRRGYWTYCPEINT